MKRGHPNAVTGLQTQVPRSLVRLVSPAGAGSRQDGAPSCIPPGSPRRRAGLLAAGEAAERANCKAAAGHGARCPLILGPVPPLAGLPPPSADARCRHSPGRCGLAPRGVETPMEKATGEQRGSVSPAAQLVQQPSVCWPLRLEGALGN